MDLKELPEELEVEVLLRLPAKYIIRCKCVCKKWLSLIESPLFVERYSHFSDARNRGKLLCYIKDPTTEAHVMSIIDYQSGDKIQDLEWPPLPDLEGVDCFSKGMKILGPVNGIYCIFRRSSDWWVGTLSLWNPATGEYKHIQPHISCPFAPEFQAGLWKSRALCEESVATNLDLGFGFDHTSNDYKVVVILQWHPELHDRGNYFFETSLYSHASDSWRTIYALEWGDAVQAPPFKELCVPLPTIRHSLDISHCLVKGNFHWPCWAPTETPIGYLGGEAYDILAFDMVAEDFRLMKGPPIPRWAHYWRSVWTFRESIAMVSFSKDPPDDLEVWVMTEYGVDDSWTRLYSFGERINWMPLGIIDDVRIFFVDENGQLISSDFGDIFQLKEHGFYETRDPPFFGTPGVLKYEHRLETLKPRSKQE